MEPGVRGVDRVVEGFRLDRVSRPTGTNALDSGCVIKGVYSDAGFHE